MSLKLAIYATLLAGVTAFSSCGPTDDHHVTGSGVDKGQSSMSFNTNVEFGGHTSIGIDGGVLTKAIRTASGTQDQITLTGSSLNGTTSHTYQLILRVPSGATTGSGNLTGDFSLPDNATIMPILTISATVAGSNPQAFTSDIGTMTITKLSLTEVEGNFSCGMKNESAETAISLSNGKFYGKF